MDNKINIISEKVIRSKTNSGDFAKHYLRLLISDDKSCTPVISVHKLLLVKDDFELFEKYGFTLMREFKDYRLYKQIFSIKIDTFNTVLEWLNMTIDKIKK